MAKYLFFTFPEYGHLNPTLAIVEELIARGEEVVYYLTEPFRQVIEATGATFRALPFNRLQVPVFSSPDEVNRRIATLPTLMFQMSTKMVPLLVKNIHEEQGDCIVCDRMFLWARIAAHILYIPVVALCPSYAMNSHYNLYAQLWGNNSFSPDMMDSLNNEFAQLSVQYGIPPFDIRSLGLDAEPLTIAFLPRAFQPAGETFDERFLFVGPSLQSSRYEHETFPLERLDGRPTLYISLGTVFNKQVDFYRLCFDAFGDTEWQVVLSFSTLDQAISHTIPDNFLVAAYVPQLAVLARTNIFISHGGMNSVMESLSNGVPLIIIPQILEQEVTAQRVQDLGLGIALNRTTVTADILREAVTRIAHDPAFRTRAQDMQQLMQAAGGYQRATEAIIQYALDNK